MSDTKTERCPVCGSSNVGRDFECDLGFFWTCSACNHNWSYPEENRPQLPAQGIADSGSTLIADSELDAEVARIIDRAQRERPYRARFEDVLKRELKAMLMRLAAVTAENERLSRLVWKEPHKLTAYSDGRLMQHAESGLRFLMREEVVGWLNEFDKVTAERDALASERDSLRAIVSRLPKTADGVPVIPGIDFVWGMVSGGVHQLEVVPGVDSGMWATFNGDDRQYVASCFSTRDAYLASLSPSDAKLRTEDRP